ncbi:3-isopropylmalate dehydratase large subunit [Paracraurococcus ruber]|uniref:3-isopropylmalate dehydratase large subunit n=1 Tax=Paracraurococcus ruber TaxID=77675 RepID=A0ABS1D0D5_9PROT|nr:3-isopropylmalate dehydratase large subunit [Paracraurococcus ruber]MBK1660269.1 3-isopropylmalate dehydratase large subunit [Paracraurococcus ruber]TDG28003.1 3-isopropylmalate dehydratase large subunit [Paracraurococcus ruber]
MTTGAQPRTLLDKIWSAHVVAQLPGADLLYVDLHLLDDLHSPQAFAALRAAGRAVRRPEAAVAVPDHTVPTTDRCAGIGDPAARRLIETLAADARWAGVPLIPFGDPRQGIVHVVGPELGLSLPGLTIASGDSHASTHGALGALAFGVGASEIEQVLATQTLLLPRPRTMAVEVAGAPAPGVSAKDLALAVVAALGPAGALGHVVEFCGDAVWALGIAGRMTLCNLAVEAGARTALVAPDDTTFDFLRGRERAPVGAAFERAVAAWRGLRSDPGATFDRVIALDAARVAPLVTWGTGPETAVPVTGVVPDPDDAPDQIERVRRRRMLDYMGLKPGQRIADLTVDVVFIGSCANGRIEDLREAATIARGGRVAPSVRALVVPGSGAVKAQAEQEGLDRILLEAGFEWREPGCSMCIAMNADRVAPGQRCASTSNRNFEGRQGPGARTHLVSPATAVAAAITGRFTDVRELTGDRASQTTL